MAGVVVGNVVEAYGSAQPIIAGGRSMRFAIGLLAGIGAVLAVVAIAVIPHAFDEVSSTAAPATTAGFVAGYLLS